MNRLNELYELTKQLEGLFEQEITVKNREDIIHQINQILDQRNHCLEKVFPPYTEAEKALGKKIVHLNTNIQKEMNLIFNDLKHEMQQIRKQKKSNQSYAHPFKSIQTMDGMFMDSKS